MLGKDVDSNKPANERKETHCQLSPVGLAAVFVAGFSFQQFISSMHDPSGRIISLLLMIVNILCFSLDIQRVRGGGYTRDSLGFWRPDASVNPKNWKK